MEKKELNECYETPEMESIGITPMSSIMEPTGGSTNEDICGLHGCPEYEGD